LLTVWLIRDFSREAVRVWWTRFRTAVSSSDTVEGSCSFAFAPSVSAVARSCLTTLRVRVFTERFRSRCRTFCAARFFACLVFAIWLCSSGLSSVGYESARL
jgi:hypothetical protein